MNEEKTKKLAILGRIFALIDDATPDGINANTFNSLVNQPGLFFNKLVNKANRYMPEYHKARFLELMKEVTEEDLNTFYLDTETSALLFAFYAEKNDLNKKGKALDHKGKMICPVVKWDDVDWSQENVRISRLKGVDTTIVQNQRDRYKQ